MTLTSNVRIARVLNAMVAGQTDLAGGVIDMADYEGVVFIASMGMLAGGAVTGLKAQQAQQPNLSNAADLKTMAVACADTDDNKFLVLDIYRPTERYLRPVVTPGTADATIDGVIAIQYGPRTFPVEQDYTVAALETNASPPMGTA